MREEVGLELTWRGFVEHLSVVDRADGRLEGWCLPGRGTRPFGGHLVAQAVALATRASGSGMTPMSVHAHFMSSGDVGRRVVYQIGSLRSGRSFEHWWVEAVQDGVQLCRATVVLHRPESGPEHAVVPRSAASPDAGEDITADPPSGTCATIRAGLEIRRVGQWHADGDGIPFQDMWCRCVESVPSDLGAAILAWCTDLEFALTIDLPYREGVTSRVGASLEHSIHFHRRVELPAWWRIEQEGLVLSQGRGLATGRVFTEQGALVATMVQRTMLRLEHGAATAPKERN